MEFLTDMVGDAPEGVDEAPVEDIKRREARQPAELAAGGRFHRLWRPPLRPGEWCTLGLFTGDTEQELREILTSLPLHAWMTVTLTPLTAHPNDPALHAER